MAVVHDTLENFIWPFYVGGPKDGERIPDDLIAGIRVRRGTLPGDDGVTYRRKVVATIGSARLAYFLAEDWDTRCYHPAHVARRVLDAHPDLRKVSYQELYGGGA